MATGRQQQQQQHGEQDSDDDESFDMKALDQFDYLRFTLTDVHGIGRSISVPRRHVTQHCLNDGLGIYAGKPVYQIRYKYDVVITYQPPMQRWKLEH